MPLPTKIKNQINPYSIFYDRTLIRVAQKLHQVEYYRPLELYVRLYELMDKASEQLMYPLSFPWIDDFMTVLDLEKDRLITQLCTQESTCSTSLEIIKRNKELKEWVGNRDKKTTDLVTALVEAFNVDKTPNVDINVLYSTLKYCLEIGAFVNFRCSSPFPFFSDQGIEKPCLLMLALSFCREKSIEDIEFLLKLFITYGADINIQCDRGFTPLLWAVKYRYKNIAHALINTMSKMKSNGIYQSEFNMRNIDGITPLVMAAYNGDTSLCRKLVQANSVVDMQDFRNYATLSRFTKRK